MARNKHKRRAGSEVHLGFQIAPMIDVVFVIMLFFMVMAGQVQKEQELSLKLPGTMTADPSNAPEVNEETRINVMESGDITLNDDPIGAPEDTDLPELAAALIKLKASTDASGGKVICVVSAEEYAKYQRVINVLNALAAARIENVTFEVPAE